MTSAFGNLVSVQTKRTLREPASVFFMLAFGPLFVTVMGAIFGTDPRPEFHDRSFIQANLVSFSSIVLAITAFVMIPVDLVGQRENGALRRFRATPLKPSTYIAADVTVRFAILTTSLVLMLVIGMVFFDADCQGSIVAVLLALLLGIAAFLAVGYAMAAALPSSGAAQAVGNTLTYPLIMVSGGAVPLDALPDGVRSVAQISPLTQLTEFLQDLWKGGTWADNLVPVAVLGGLLVVATGIGARFFRWE
ncbi:ABC transporter permease [Streptomyces sp. NPDC058045]|uniref:ABC transporter permease n=1 Tax=Streptomyces sp. NPDC058045 TaxID=3346311 RepID=UPI0036EE7B37